MSGDQIVDIPLTPPEALLGLRCEEANFHGVNKPNGEPYPCGAQAVAIVWHGRPGERQYAMCDMCTDHNVRNRHGRLLLITSPELRLALAKKEFEKRANNL